MEPYQYRPGKGASYGQEEAALLGKFIEESGGRFRPQDLVDAARPANSPLHKLFEWDDTEAAEHWRLHQARVIVATLDLVISEDKSSKAAHSVTLEISGEQHRRYCHAIHVASDDDLRRQVLERALAEIERWKYRYAEYRDAFDEIFKAIQKAKRLVKKKKPKKKMAAMA